MNLFDVLKEISLKKTDITDSPSFNKAYDPFMINSYLSMSADCCHLAQFMDMYDDIPKDLQYKFYMLMVEPKNRYFNYKKSGANFIKSDIDIISKYFQVNSKDAEEIIGLLSDEQFENIKKAWGGK